MVTETTTLVSVVYVSSASCELPASELVDILQASQRNNTPLSVTGMLLFRDGNFMQVLEGPEQAVQQVLDKVKRDPRHHGLILLNKRKTKRRQFGNWAMAFRNLSEIPPGSEESFSQFLSNSLLDAKFRAEPDLCYRLLLSFKENIR